MPTNLYGPNDNYDLQSSHVLPALLKKFYDAKTNNKSEVVVWGSGLPKREFLHVDDLAEACVLVIKENTNEILFNVGSGTEISISSLAKLIKKIIEYDGDIIFDNSKPDGVMQKLIDSSRIKNLGWEFKINLETGIKKTLKDSFK